MPWIIVADREPNIRRLICANLGMRGYRSIEASNLTGFRDILLKTQEHPAAAIIDVQLDNAIDCNSLVECIASLPVRLPLVLITTSVEMALKFQTQAGIQVPVLLKPFTSIELFEALQDAVSGWQNSSQL
jgi:CheY-like chemotaxis protein